MKSVVPVSLAQALELADELAVEDRPAAGTAIGR